MDFSEALNRNPQYANAYYCRGYAKEKLGDLVGAQEDYHQALKLDPALPVPVLLRRS